jgi:hypothetical protein
MSNHVSELSVTTCRKPGSPDLPATSLASARTPKPWNAVLLNGRSCRSTGRCWSAAHDPAPGPINDQDLRVVAPALRPSDPSAAATQVAVAVSEMLIRIRKLLQPTENISAREIPLGVTKILLRQAEVLSGGTEATVVAVAMVAMVAVVAMVVVVVVVAEQSLQETETWQDTEHSCCSFSLGGARACFMPTLQVPRLLWCRRGETGSHRDRDFVNRLARSP